MASTVNYARIQASHDATEPWTDDTMKPQPDSTSRESTSRRIYWRPPALMSLSFLLGVAFAVLHHLFYSHWNDIDLSAAWPQIWISRVGTALAFLTKLFLAIASSIAYVQQQWLTMHKNTFQLQEADTLFGILGDATLFLDLRIWLRNPLLAIPALVTWLVPIAAVITPGSLTVVNPNVTSAQSLYVPQISFNGIEYTYQGAGGSQYYLQTKESVQRLSQSTAMFGAIPQLPYPASNASYRLTYSTPALRCNDAAALLGPNFTTFNNGSSYGGYLYFSFVAGDTQWASLNRTAITKFNDGILPSKWDTIDRTSQDAATLYIASRDLGNLNNTDYYYIECKLWNATQTVDFEFVFPSQVITIQSPIEYSRGFSAYDYGVGPIIAVNNSRGLAYVALMDMFGTVFAGGITVDHYSQTLRPIQTLARLTQVDWSSRDKAIADLEQLFQNMTLSLMTDARFVQTPAQIGNISVNVTTYPSRYSYSWRELVLAYGIGIACALFSMLIGVQALVRNHTSFSNRCSTILRSFKGSQLDSRLSIADDGADPLPKKLKKVQVAL